MTYEFTKKIRVVPNVQKHCLARAKLPRHRLYRSLSRPLKLGLQFRDEAILQLHLLGQPFGRVVTHVSRHDAASGSTEVVG